MRIGSTALQAGNLVGRVEGRGFMEIIFIPKTDTVAALLKPQDSLTNRSELP